MSEKNSLTRRDFLYTAAAGTGALFTLGAPGLAGAAGALPATALGKTGVKLPILCFGTAFNLTSRLLHVALREGLYWLDTAEGYNNGNSERAIGEVLDRSGNRKDLFIVSKSGQKDPALWEERLGGSLERMKTDYVDAYYIHNLGDPAHLSAEMKAKAEELKQAGKIRFFGFSTHHRNMIAVLHKAAEVGFVDMVMFKYNFLDYDNAELNRAIDACVFCRFRTATAARISSGENILPQAHSVAVS